MNDFPAMMSTDQTPAAAPQFQPLAGVRIVDLSKVLAGPLCTQYLADLGATVIKVEPCNGGDDTRSWPPVTGEDGAVFLSANRNKQSLAVDLKNPAGREVLMRLIETSDVLVESYRKGAMERLGLGHEALRTAYPRLIYASVSGFGRTGPLSDLPGYDVMVQAFSGMMSITGEKDGGPVRSAFSPLDQTTGIWAAFGILAALRQRDATGEGRYLEVSLFETAVAFLGYHAQTYWTNGKAPERCGSGHDALCPYQAFNAADGHILIAVGNDSLWRRFCAATGLDAYADDPHFRTNRDRVAHFDETVALVGARVAEKTVAQWTTILTEAGVPTSPVHTIPDVLQMPHTAARGIVMEYEHPAYGPMKTMAMPVCFDGAARGVTLAPPTLGQHTVDVLASLGYDAAAIEALRKNGVVVSASGDCPPAV